MVKSIRARRWVFTLNNYTEEELDQISGIECRYLLYGKEQGEKGTPHLQGYIVFDNAKRFQTLKKLIPRAHLEPAGGSHDENYAYCTKEDPNPFQKGELPEDRREKMHIKHIIKRDPVNATKIIASQRLLLGMELERDMLQEVKLNILKKPEIVYVYGATGTGKTYFALQDATIKFGVKGVSILKFDKNGFAHCNNPNNQCLVWMEFRPSCLAATDFLELTDGYGCFLNVKHGSIFIRPESIYICSILHPREIYKEEINQQFMRRITRFVDKDKDPYHNYIDNSETDQESN